MGIDWGYFHRNWHILRAMGLSLFTISIGSLCMNIASFSYDRINAYREWPENECSFSGETCALGSSSALFFDTGLIDANAIVFDSATPFHKLPAFESRWGVADARERNSSPQA